jgi:hypothetical protein
MVKKKKNGKKLPRTIQVTHQIGTSITPLDRRLLALKPGKRISKFGNVYWEYRKNRSDVSPKKKL